MCQQGAFTPIGNPEVKEPAVPLQSQPVLKSVYTNRENGVCIYTSQNEKIPTVDPPARRGKTVGIIYAAFIELGEIHASPTAAAVEERTQELRLKDRFLPIFYTSDHCLYRRIYFLPV